MDFMINLLECHSDQLSKSKKLAGLGSSDIIGENVISKYNLTKRFKFGFVGVSNGKIF